MFEGKMQWYETYKEVVVNNFWTFELKEVFVGSSETFEKFAVYLKLKENAYTFYSNNSNVTLDFGFLLLVNLSDDSITAEIAPTKYLYLYKVVIE